MLPPWDRLFNTPDDVVRLTRAMIAEAWVVRSAAKKIQIRAEHTQQQPRRQRERSVTMRGEIIDEQQAGH